MEAIRPQDSSPSQSTRGRNPSCNSIRSSPAMAISRPALLLLVLHLTTTTISASPKLERDVTELQIGVKFKPTICDLKAHKGDHVSVHYRGTLLDGTEFDESYGRGEPLDFKLGEGTVIKGWDQGLLGMCVGEKRKLKIPAKLGYGEEGAPPEIPGGATLIFETELVSVNGKTGSGPDDVLEPLMDPNFEEEEEFGDEEEFGGRKEGFDEEEEEL